MNKQIIASVVRHLLGFAGGYLAAKGIELDSASVEAISGGVAAFVALAWSVYEKKKAPAPSPVEGKD